MKRQLFILGVMAALVAGGRSARAEDLRPLHELLPQDTLAFAEFDPEAAPTGSRENHTTLIDVGLQAMQSLGVLRAEASVVADVMGLAGEAGVRRSCVAWLDADLRVKRTPAGLGLDCRAVQLVWIVETDQPTEMIERLTRVVSHYATAATATQGVRMTSESKKEYVEFRDKNWPLWLTLAWAQEIPAAGDTAHKARFVVAMGPGAMAHYLANRPVGEASWQQTVTNFETLEGGTALTFARVFVMPKIFRERFPDAMRQTVLGKLFTSMDLASADSCLFTAKLRGRAVSLGTMSMERGKIVSTPWTVTVPEGAPLMRAVPEDASAYLVLNMQWPVFYQRVISLWDAILTDPTDEPVGKMIAGMAHDQGVDIQKDILGRLQPYLLVHDSPQHPLRLPLMVTGVSATEAGGEEKVKAALKKMADGAAAALDRKAAEKAARTVVVVPDGAETPATKPDFTRLRLRTDSDGVSYLQFGLVGPAWGWVQNRLVVSWSPSAVRANQAAVGRVTSAAFAPSAATVPATAPPRGSEMVPIK